ncbi:TonB-dependent siderophore receptor [Sphingomonas jatrophae]|uniref:Iron complex outermembrane recepter protein n=1 Tax=Sphingomonas jatrophae TaxID=1166337 RepID=A0A1I6M7X7_9SPHN|nr:TonB-dependent siderophore receptor [Sphingomonas jatrophae]SFS11804.1 iron complex outermembrane recepter protein [Sphingomonas jatrophae]
MRILAAIKHWRLAGVGLTALCAWSPAVAEDAPAEDTAAAREHEHSDVDEIVVLGRRRIDRVNGSDVVTERMSQASIALDRTILDDYGVRRLSDALELVSGISQQNNLGGLRDNYAIRGFLGTPDTGAEYFVDGFLANRGFGPPRDPANVERVEVLKGPVGAVFGSVDPAGLVNIVTKKPQFRTGGVFTASAGSFATYRLEGDVESLLADTLSIRLVGALENSDGYRDFVDLRRHLFAPSLSWRPAPGTTLTYQGEYIQYRSPFDRGIPAVNGDAEAVPRDRFLGEPADGRVSSRNWRHEATLEQDLGGGWSLVGGGAYRDGRIFGFSTETSTAPVNGIVTRQRRLRDWNLTDWSARAEVRGTVEAFGTHRPSLGATFYDLDFDTYQTRFRPSAARPYAIDVFDPVYGGTAGPLTPFTVTNERRKAVALYAQDMWEATDALSVVAGLRYEHLKQRIDNIRSGQLSRLTRDPVEFRAGVRYRPDPRFAFHANWGEGFRPNSSVGREGQAFAPETGKGYEIGGKLVLPALRVTASWFSVSKRNILATDPVDANFLAPVGRIRSRGVELDGEIDLARGVRLIGNYAFTDAEARDPAFPSADVLNVPRHSGTLQLFASLPVAGRDLDLSFGGTYVGPRAAALDGGNLRLGRYVKVKASAAYALTDRLTARVEVDNLLDQTYAQSSYSALWIYPGAPRSITAALTIRM